MQKVQWKVNYIANICTAGTCEDLYLNKSRRYFHRDNKRTLWASKFHQLKHKPYLQSEGHKSVKKKLFLYYYLIFFHILDIFTDLSFEICHHVFKSNTPNTSIWNQTQTWRVWFLKLREFLKLFFLYAFIHRSVYRFLHISAIFILDLNQNHSFFSKEFTIMNNLSSSKAIGSFTVLATYKLCFKQRNKLWKWSKTWLSTVIFATQHLLWIGVLI